MLSASQLGVPARRMGCMVAFLGGDTSQNLTSVTRRMDDDIIR